MSDIITSGITPAMIPGLRKAIEVCEAYSSENMRIAVDDVQRICRTDEWKDLHNHDTAVIHNCMSRASSLIAKHLSILIGEGDVA